MLPDIFHCKQFDVEQSEAAMKVNTDALCLGAWAEIPSSGRVLDIGSGSGIISLMLAQRSSDQLILGIDPHKGSFESTAWNFNQSRWPDRMQALQMDLASFVNRSKPDSFQCIVSNPPYFNKGILPTEEKHKSAKHMGLLNEETIAQCAARLLAPRGVISLIYPPDQMNRFESYCFGLNLFPIKKCHIHSTDSSLAIRMMATFSFDMPDQIEEEKLIIYDHERNYTEQYRSILKDFLTIF